MHYPRSCIMARYLRQYSLRLPGMFIPARHAANPDVPSISSVKVVTNVFGYSVVTLQIVSTNSEWRGAPATKNWGGRQMQTGVRGEGPGKVLMATSFLPLRKFPYLYGSGQIGKPTFEISRFQIG